MAMEGNGPRSGKPKKLSVLLLSTDPIAIDATACRIIDLDPEVVPTSRPGEQAGLGTYHIENIEIVGENMEEFLNQTFDVIRTPPMPCTSGRLRTFIKNRICEKPVVDKAKCTNCGTCVRMCPVEPKAINWHTGDTSKPPTLRYDLCIRCYCCQETCPEGAILPESPFLSRLLQRVYMPARNRLSSGFQHTLWLCSYMHRNSGALDIGLSSLSCSRFYRVAGFFPGIIAAFQRP